MRFNFLSAFLFVLLIVPGWENDFETAKQKAHEQQKLILLEFSGSDWCVPCIRFRTGILETTRFKNFADSALILLNADFPRLKKNKLSKEQQMKNDKLAEKFNPNGVFPMTVLLDADGRLLKTWEGYPNLSAEQFISQIKATRDARK